MLFNVILAVRLVFLLCLWALAAGSKGNPNPAMLKGKTARMRVMLSHSLTREQKGHRKTFTPDFASVFESHSKVIHSIDDGGVHGTQLYARKHGTSVWQFLKSLPNDQTYLSLSSLISEGGIVAENARVDMDKWVATKVFGAGMGDPLLLNSVRSTLPQLKRLKPQQIQFGYRVADEDIGAIERSMVIGAPSARKMFSGMSPAEQITTADKLTDITANNIAQILRDPASIHSIRHRDGLQEIIALNHRIEQYARTLLAHNVAKVLVCTDGSAHFNDAGCVLAGGGVALTAVYTDHQQGADMQVVDTYNKSVSMCVRASDMECMTTTPFDAELLSGLTGLVVTKLLLHHRSALQRAMRTVPTGQRLDYSISLAVNNSGCSTVEGSTPLSTPSPLPRLSVELCSDSRTYIRALRTDLSVDLTARNEHNRLAVWQLATALHRSIIANSTEGSGHVAVRWMAGHPERSNANVSR